MQQLLAGLPRRYARSCVPCLGDELGEAYEKINPVSKRIYAAQKYRRERTDVVGVELVDADENTDGRRPEHPGQSPAEHGELAGVEVVDEDAVELLGRLACLP